MPPLESKSWKALKDSVAELAHAEGRAMAVLQFKNSLDGKGEGDCRVIMNGPGDAIGLLLMLINQIQAAAFRHGDFGFEEEINKVDTLVKNLFKAAITSTSEAKERLN